MESRTPNLYPTGFEYPYSAPHLYELELRFDIFLLKKELKFENYFVSTILFFKQRK
jgi:hypothetical protein